MPDMQLWAVVFWHPKRLEVPCWFQGKQLAWKGGTVSTGTQILVRYEGTNVFLTWPVRQRLQKRGYRNIATQAGLAEGGVLMYPRRKRRRLPSEAPLKRGLFDGLPDPEPARRPRKKAARRQRSGRASR